MCNHSEEGDADCLGIFNTAVKKFPRPEALNGPDSELKVPHMGWNVLDSKSDMETNGILKHTSGTDDVYYVHSFYAEICKDTVASCNYILPFSSVLQKNNFYATQLHPEKSAKVGEQILKNFIELWE